MFLMAPAGSMYGATQRDNPALLQKLLKQTKLYALDDLSQALQLACQMGFEECARLLLDAGALPNLHNATGFTPLILAAKQGHPHIVRLLINKGCNVNKCTFRIRATALHWAATYGHTACIKSILQGGGKRDAQTIHGRTALMLASRSDQEEAVEMILSTKCDVNLHDFEKATALHLAAEEGATECVRSLLSAGAIIDERRRNECTPLMLAAQRGHLKTLRLLIRQGADINMAGQMMTPLHWASDQGHTACVGNLLERVEDPDIPTQDCHHGAQFMVNKGVTPLMLACRNGHLETATLLLQHGCDCNKQDSEEMTPLLYSIHKGYSRCVEYLLSNGAFPDGIVQDGSISGLSPLFHAVKRNSRNCVRALLKANCNLYVIGIIGSQEVVLVLDLALMKGHVDIIRMFLSVGYDTRHINISAFSESLKFLCEEDKELYDEILDSIISPRSLKQMCRIVIRNSLRLGIQLKIPQLPLPSSIKLYLDLHDLDDF